ncbi:MAG: rod shape-determining protein MreD [Bacilli bacterium]|nr:rod shape-determining protein MreD [Bacilli bacterium]
MRKILTIIYLIFFIVLIFTLQIMLIDGRTILCFKPNLILITVIVVSLCFGLYAGSFYGLIIGIITDILFGNNIGMFTIVYSIIGALIGFFSYNYRKENKIALVYVTVIATAVFEFVQYIMYFVISSHYNSILYLLYQLFATSVLNVVIVFIVYSLLYKILSFFENRLNMYDM